MCIPNHFRCAALSEQRKPEGNNCSDLRARDGSGTRHAGKKVERLEGDVPTDSRGSTKGIHLPSVPESGQLLCGEGLPLVVPWARGGTKLLEEKHVKGKD